MQGSPGTELRHAAAVFLLWQMDDLIYCHFPTLCNTATAAHPNLPPTRLVVLDISAEKQIINALGRPTGASTIAILDDGKDVPGMEALMSYVLDHTTPVEVPWVREVIEGKWLGTKISPQQG